MTGGMGMSGVLQRKPATCIKAVDRLREACQKCVRLARVLVGHHKSRHSPITPPPPMTNGMTTQVLLMLIQETVRYFDSI